jgi:serine/threonine protein phosphatase PrpC
MPRTRTLETVVAAGATDPGLQRQVNEDRFHADEARGLFIVIDGVGGQAAGGRAADLALSLLRERLERETGPVPDRVREAIAVANNEIYRLAATRPEWDGMACVLTVAVVKDGMATVGHVGDTRLYKLHGDCIDKITRDHSPVGEREDAGEISELEAMRHPRRNEVYRDVGSEPHAPDDPEFVEIHEVPFGAGDALLLCSDGLTDVVDSATILRTVAERAGDPRAVARALVDAANAGGGKDNVTAVFVEGGTFATSRSSGFLGSQHDAARTSAAAVSVPGPSGSALDPAGTVLRRRRVAAALGVALFVTALMVYRIAVFPFSPDAPVADASAAARPTQTVRPGESIAAALSRAQPGSEILVEPGDYRERLALDGRVRLVSRVPRGATIRLPATTADAYAEPAVVASGSSGGELVGFRIVGDAGSPLGIGVFVAGSGLSLVDIEVSGAATAAIAFARDSRATLVGSDIHDNPGAALDIRAGASPRITHNVFRGNGLSQHTPATFAIDRGAAPLFERNVFVGVRPGVFALIEEAGRLKLHSENWFLPAGSPGPEGRAPSGASQGRR